MLRLILLLLLIFLLYRIVRNFLKTNSIAFDNKFKNKKQKQSVDYKNIEEAHYTEIKDDQKQS